MPPCICRAVNSGVHVITPNKRLTSAALTYYQAVQQAQFHKPDGSLRPAGHATRVFYEVLSSLLLFPDPDSWCTKDKPACDMKIIAVVSLAQAWLSHVGSIIIPVKRLNHLLLLPLALELI